MSDYSENDEQRVSNQPNQGYELEDAVQEALDDWRADESLPVYGKDEYIVAKEDLLVKHITVMIATAINESTE
ncbi:hypothetical protein [Halorubrum sp. FL23]|uniref:hypothetical protein n=1 Tax=Halorubrum sp. FL23 TaxID=3458704 RepID=UPI0040334D8B